MKTSVLRELRAVQRFEIELPVVLTSRSGYSSEAFEASTRDISTRGMFVTSNVAFSEGEILDFEIDLAWDELTPLVMVEGEGRVVRVERDAESSRLTGFAVENLWFKLRDPQQGQAIPTQASSPTLPDFSRALAGNSKPIRRLSIVPKDGDLNSRGNK